MRRFFVEDLSDQEATFTMTGSEARHMSRVLRMKPGDRMVLMDGKGRHYQAAVTRISRHEVRGVLETRLSIPPPSPVNITLLQALLKSGPMDYLVQKTSELGADRIVPFASERTVVRPEAERLTHKMAHWKRIATGAAKQSGRVDPLVVAPISSFTDLLDGYKEVHALKVILWEGEETTDLRRVLKTAPPPGQFVGMVGPEGGFSEEELGLARAGGFVPASLGWRILRAETAAITLTAVVQYEVGDLGLKEPLQDLQTDPRSGRAPDPAH